MSIKYSCFISYRHNLGSTHNAFVLQLQEALDNEIQPLIGLKSYLDTDNLTGGDYFEKKLQNALCHSVCLIVVYIPMYFNEDKTFCTREFMAMKRIEKYRFRRLEKKVFDESFIIPIRYRVDPPVVHNGIQDVLFNKMQYYDFSNFSLGEWRISRNSKYMKEISELAQSIHEKYHMLQSINNHLDEICQNFKFPTESEACCWLQKNKIVFNPPKFPGRKA